MPIIKGLSKIGSSYSIILDKALMQLLDLTPESKVEIRTNGTSMIITPIAPDKEYQVLDPSLKDAFEHSLQKYSETYKKLAE